MNILGIHVIIRWCIPTKWFVVAGDECHALKKTHDDCRDHFYRVLFHFNALKQMTTHHPKQCLFHNLMISMLIYPMSTGHFWNIRTTQNSEKTSAFFPTRSKQQKLTSGFVAQKVHSLQWFCDFRAVAAMMEGLSFWSLSHWFRMTGPPKTYLKTTKPLEVYTACLGV